MLYFSNGGHPGAYMSMFKPGDIIMHVGTKDILLIIDLYDSEYELYDIDHGDFDYYHEIIVERDSILVTDIFRGSY